MDPSYPTRRAQLPCASRAKRLFDVILTLLLMTIAAPLFLFLALSVQAMLRSPIPFRHQRRLIWNTHHVFEVSHDGYCL